MCGSRVCDSHKQNEDIMATRPINTATTASGTKPPSSRSTKPLNDPLMDQPSNEASDQPAIPQDDQQYLEDAPEYDPDGNPVSAVEEPPVEEEGVDSSEPPEYQPIEPNNMNVYHVGQDCSIKNQFYPKGSRVALTPEELATVQDVDLQFYHPVEAQSADSRPTDVQAGVQSNTQIRPDQPREERPLTDRAPGEPMPHQRNTPAP
jgi:hypothetical protein